MSFLSGLKKLSLRRVPTHEKTDTSKPNLDPGFAGTPQQEEAYRETVLEANIESWLDLVGEHTFATKLLPITPEDGQLFIDAYQHYENYSKQCVVAGVPANDFKMPDDIVQQAALLEGKLQKVIDMVRGDEAEPVFVKASSRSPKDAPASQAHLKDAYLHFVRQAPVKDENAKIKALLQAGLELLKIRSAKQALDLFLHSERIFQDMLLAKGHMDRWEENFVVRRWVDIDVDMEFRGFAHGGQLTALSQYNHLCYFPRLVELKEAIEHKVRSFFDNEMKDRLKSIASYIIDFALVGQGAIEDMTVMVIELNPFLETTDGCLFSWQRERQTLEQGPFEFRLCTSVRRGASSLVSHDWRDLLKLSDEELEPTQPVSSPAAASSDTSEAPQPELPQTAATPSTAADPLSCLPPLEECSPQQLLRYIAITRRTRVIGFPTRAWLLKYAQNL